MAIYWEAMEAYPWLAVALILVPLIGGFIGAGIGADNLRSRLEADRQKIEDAKRYDERTAQIAKLQVPVDTLRRYEATLEQNGQNFELLRHIIAQYDRLQSGIRVHEGFVGALDIGARLATAAEIIASLRSQIGNISTVAVQGGDALIIKTAPNMFKVIFPVPMRITPALGFPDLPAGVTPQVLEASPIGFTVHFAPESIAVDKLHFSASAEL